MMATHKVLVTLYDGGRMIYENELVEYDGPPDWKHEPLNLDERKTWLETVADPDKVDATRERMSHQIRGPLSIVE